MGNQDKIVIHLSEGRNDYDKVIVSLKEKLEKRGLIVGVVPHRSSSSIRPAITTVEIPGGGRIEGLGGICKRVDERLEQMRSLEVPTGSFMKEGAYASP